MTRSQTGRIEAAIIDALDRCPLTLTELTVKLHRAEEIPPYWAYPNVSAVVRRLHQRGALTRLDFPGVSRTVLWWA